MTRWSRANTGSCSSQFCHEPDRPWMKTTRRSRAQVDHVDPPPVDRHPPLVLAPVDVQPGRAPAGTVVAGRVGQAWRLVRHARRRIIGGREGLAACASPSTSTRRCTTTGTSSRTPPSAASASSCPTTSSTRGRSAACATSSCAPSSPTRTPTRPSPAPSPTRTRSRSSTRWHEGGHWIHITSHRAERCHPATRQWLAAIGLRHDDLHCSYDKVSRCVRARRRPPHRRQPGHPRPARSRTAWSPRRSCTRGTGTCARRRPTSSAPTTGPGLAAALELRLPRLRRAA